MWSELPKLFGKSFAIGYFLPSAAILLCLLGVASAFGYYDRMATLLIKSDSAKSYSEWLGAAISIFILWVGGVALMALNRPIIRFFEGYSKYNPLRLLLLPSKKRSFARLTAAIAELRKEGRVLATATGTSWSASRRELYNNLMSEQVQYPDREDFVLPTRFGNVLRAFEVYSRVIYGLEAIQGWPRLVSVIPVDFRETIDDAKAQLDFWVNLWVGGLVVALFYGVLFAAKGLVPQPWIPAVALLIAFFAANGARAAAGQWGALVMSAFDLFRGDLCKKLGLKMPSTITKEREMWQLMSQVMTYRSQEAADRLSHFRDTAGESAPCAASAPAPD
jgi:hypothetical protein